MKLFGRRLFLGNTVGILGTSKFKVEYKPFSQAEVAAAAKANPKSILPRFVFVCAGDEGIFGPPLEKVWLDEEKYRINFKFRTFWPDKNHDFMVVGFEFNPEQFRAVLSRVGREKDDGKAT